MRSAELENRYERNDEGFVMSVKLQDSRYARWQSVR